MPLRQDLLDELVCPVDHSDLELKPDGKGLRCVQCKRLYPIRLVDPKRPELGEIPVMLESEAIIEE